MSSAGSRQSGARRPDEWDRLELAVRRLLDAYDQWCQRALVAERRASELDAALRDISEGRLDPVELVRRVESLEAENEALRERLAAAREQVSRILTRLQFLEEDR